MYYWQSQQNISYKTNSNKKHVIILQAGLGPIVPDPFRHQAPTDQSHTRRTKQICDFVYLDKADEHGGCPVVGSLQQQTINTAGACLHPQQL